MILNNLLKKLPFPINQTAKYFYGNIPPRFRYGNVFWKTYDFLQKSQFWSREKLEDYQMQQLNKLLRHAYENVPYYQRIFDERGLKPKDIQNFDEMKKLPFLTKEIIRENLPDLIAQNYPKSKLRYTTTGGSTGIPLGFYHERGVSDAVEWAFMLTQWNRVGFEMGSKRVILRGNVIQSASKGKLWEYDPVNKSLILSSYYMTDETMPKYVQLINEFQPDFLHVYPSAITILARFMKEHSLRLYRGVQAVLCGSENLYLWQRKLLEEVFQCRVFSWYGHEEQAALAGECEQSIYYHIFPEYGIVELCDQNGTAVDRENELVEIVATGLNNFIFPLIRYKTMDLAMVSTSGCGCGRNYPLIEKVEGRLQELIVSGTGRMISMTAINMHSDVLNNVKQFQFYQDKRGELFINIIKRETYKESDTEYIKRELYKKLGDDMKLIIRFVEHIPLTERGKYRFLIQKMTLDFGDK